MSLRSVLTVPVATLLLGANAHTWPVWPRPRGYAAAATPPSNHGPQTDDPWKTNLGHCLKDEQGHTNWPLTSGGFHGSAICNDLCGGTGAVCGIDALGVDIRNTRPSTFHDNPCVISRANAGYTPNDLYAAPMTKVAPGGKLCVSWAGNGHTVEVGGPLHNARGGVRWAWSEKANPTLADFDTNVITYMPYESGGTGGSMLQLPKAMVAGHTYTLLLTWDWPTSGPTPKFMNSNADAFLYANCMDIEVTDNAPWPHGLPSSVNIKYRHEGAGEACNVETGKTYNQKSFPVCDGTTNPDTCQWSFFTGKSLSSFNTTELQAVI